MNYSGIYAYANVGNYGLGHSLLAWARCHLWSVRHNVEMLAPSWLQIRGRIGPILRRERDSRQYHRLFQFPDYLTGLRRSWVLSTAPRIEAEELDLDAYLSSNRAGLVVFKNRLSLNEETHFAEIVGHSQALKTALTRMTREEYRPQPASGKHIALHVRMGDFSAASSLDALRKGAKNSRIPVDWYVRMLTALRRQVGPVPARLYSDGSDADLTPLLVLPGVERPPKQPSVTDLLGISQARLVISSGSGFSMWGAFLGESPRICFPGQRFTRVLLRIDDDQPELEPECESWDELAASTVRAIEARMARA